MSYGIMAFERLQQWQKATTVLHALFEINHSHIRGSHKGSAGFALGQRIDVQLVHADESRVILLDERKHQKELIGFRADIGTTSGYIVTAKSLFSGSYEDDVYAGEMDCGNVSFRFADGSHLNLREA